VVHPYQVVEAAAYGADLVLLIVAALPQVDLTALLHEAARHELAAIVEVHDEHELARALDAGAEIVGVNARDLTTLWRSTARPSTPAPRLPDDVVAAPVEAGVRPDP
jgi:indole-3-glycerol phosphate synthase